MSWLVKVIVDSEDAEQLTNRFWGAGTNGVAEIADPYGPHHLALLDRETPVPGQESSSGRPGSQVLLIAGFDTEPEAHQASALCPISVVEPLDSGAWNGPPAAEVSVAGLTITIDSGQAFGHGQHPTTSMVADTFTALLARDASLLDVGTGTGVLSIAAKKLGAGRVVAIDNDPEAIRSAANNAEINDASIEIVDTPVASLADRGEPFDVVVANMLLADIRPIAPDIKKLVGETLIVSGFLEDQVDAILELFVPLRPISQLTREGWACTVLR